MLSSERRQLIIEVLSGITTPVNRPALLQDDILFFAVRIAEHDEPDWLLAQIADTTLPLAGRTLVVGEMTELKRKGIEILKPEDPGIERLAPPWEKR